MERRIEGDRRDLFARLAAYAAAREAIGGPIDAAAEHDRLLAGFDIGLPQAGRPADEVIADLIEAAEPGLIGSRREGFLAWVIGGSSRAGVAADWLTALWGQNAGLYQCSPAAAVAEQVCEKWLLELMDLPRESSAAFVTGATMAGFVGLAAARGEVLRRAGYDIDRGLRGAPPVTILIGEDAHVTNFAALRYLGFGEEDFVRVEAAPSGVMEPEALKAAAARVSGPAIVIVQAGHIHSGAFDDFETAADVAADLGGWLHVDGAFGLWARSVPELAPLCRGVELADSWSVDGHKWLQVPYDSGFAIVRDRAAHRRAMAKSAGYLNESEEGGREPAHYHPELSRRARGFAVWATVQALGRDGIANMVRSHCEAARELARRCERMPGVRVVNDVVLNQVTLDLGERTQAVCDAINAEGALFLRIAEWQGRTILRVSFAGEENDVGTARHLGERLEALAGR